MISRPTWALCQRFKDSNDLSFIAQNRVPKLLVPGGLPGAVYRSQNIEQLPTDRCIGLEWYRPQLGGQLVGGSMLCQADEVGFEFSVPLGLDPNMRTVLEVRSAVPQSATRTVADRVPGVLDRHFPHILDDSPLQFEEGVSTGRGNDHEESTMPEIPKICLTHLLATGARPLGGLDRVSLKQLVIDGSRIFAGRNRAGHKVPVTMSDVLDDLLNEPFNRSRLDGILPRHAPVMGKVWGLVSWKRAKSPKLSFKKSSWQPMSIVLIWRHGQILSQSLWKQPKEPPVTMPRRYRQSKAIRPLTDHLGGCY
jgi:hypothetical protein